MGLLDEPVTKKRKESGSDVGIRFASCSMQGWRNHMEDAHTALTALGSPFDLWSFFGVFDGHAGDRVSKYCSQHLMDCITKTKEFLQIKSEMPSEEETRNLMKRGLIKGFLKVDEEIRHLPESQLNGDHAGSTATCALITPDTVYLVNCGDSRGIIVSKQTVTAATSVHKPTQPAEKERIQEAGESVKKKRVGGTLAMSRAIGNFEYKSVPGMKKLQQPVIAKPDVFDWTRTPDDEFVLLACDGLWDVMSEEEASEFVREHLRHTEDHESLCRKLVDHCLKKGSHDNISVVLVVFCKDSCYSMQKGIPPNTSNSTVEDLRKDDGGVTGENNVPTAGINVSDELAKRTLEQRSNCSRSSNEKGTRSGSETSTSSNKTPKNKRGKRRRHKKRRLPNSAEV